MKKSLRFASAALAVALAASCAAPAFAAGSSSFTKSETVYAVMNADGSIQSTTVSEHVYSASGLSKVTDQSTLTNIQNTESSAEFTQDGEKLVWNTDDTDVYYKGDTDRALPIQATVTYALDGQEAALEDLIGKSGHLTMTIALKNNETGTVNVNGTDRTIVTPLVTAVGVIFGQDATNVVAAHGLVESAAKSNVAAFVTLPRQLLDPLRIRYIMDAVEEGQLLPIKMLCHCLIRCEHEILDQHSRYIPLVRLNIQWMSFLI